MDFPASYQVVPYVQIFRRRAYISHLPKCITYPTEATPTDFTTLAGIIYTAEQIQNYGIHHVTFSIHLLVPCLRLSHFQAAFSDTFNLQPHRNATPVYLNDLLEGRRNSQRSLSYRDFTIKSNLTYRWLPDLSVLMADFAVLVSLGIQISDFDSVKFDSGGGNEIKKKVCFPFPFAYEWSWTTVTKAVKICSSSFTVQSSFGQTQTKG